jgi:pimeloyl-ACP methyl ester carboxylesterase
MRRVVRTRAFLAAVLAATVVALGGPAAARDVERGPEIRRIPVRSADGAAFDIVVTDQGRGLPVVFLHGLGASSHIWRRVLPELPPGRRLITIDLKGFGRSDKPIDFRYAIEDHAAAVESVLASLDLRNVTLVGHSFGGAVALLMAVRQTDRAELRGERSRTKWNRLERLVLIDSPAYPQRPTRAVRFLRRPLAAYLGLAIVPPEVLVIGALRSELGLPQGLTADDVAAYAQPFVERGAKHALIETAIGLEPVDFRAVVEGYRRVSLQALLVWCRTDPVVPLAIGQRLSRDLPAARLEIIDGCSHVPSEERPGPLAQILGRFILSAAREP